MCGAVHLIAFLLAIHRSAALAVSAGAPLRRSHATRIPQNNMFCKAADGKPEDMDAPPLPSLGRSLQGGLLRVIGSSSLGAASGSAAHAWILPVVPVPWVDAALNVFTVVSGLAVGATCGILWATEAALLSSGLIVAAFQQSLRMVVDNERDELAGARALEVIRETLDRLRNLGGLRGFLLSSALFACGLYDDPAIERLATEAAAARDGQNNARPRSLSELLGLAVESTLSARFFELKLLLVTLAVVLVSGIDGGVYALVKLAS